MPGLKIISYSLWGHDDKYTRGALANVELAKKFYPGWNCQFHVDMTTAPWVLDELAITRISEIVIHRRGEGWRGLFWRFLPACDPTIERMVSRDTDSRHNEREADAVREWEESGRPFHIMRDHRAHSVPILGGMWGCRPTAVAPWFKKNLDEWLAMMQPIHGRKGLYFDQDQRFLRFAVWPNVKDNHIAHDDAARYEGPDVRKFRVSLPDGHFIGEQYP